MTRTFTALCAAAAFGVVAPLAAQKPYTPPATGTSGQGSTYGTSANNDKNDVTLTGCLSKDANGNYVLTNVSRSGMGSSSAGASRGTTGTTSGMSGTSAASGTSSRGYGSNSGSAMESGTTWRLTGGKDLDKHIGHKIQVTGRAYPNSSESGSSYGTSGTAGTSGTTGTMSGSATGSSAGQYGTNGSSQKTSNGQQGRRLEVKKVKMISTSCS